MRIIRIQLLRRATRQGHFKAYKVISATVGCQRNGCHRYRILQRWQYNVFKNVSNNYYVTVSAARGITISNNTFETRSTETAKKVGKAIYINLCMNINISDNTYSKFANGDVTKVIVGNNYIGLAGSDVEGVFERDKLSEAEAQ